MTLHPKATIAALAAAYPGIEWSRMNNEASAITGKIGRLHILVCRVMVDEWDRDLDAADDLPWRSMLMKRPRLEPDAFVFAEEDQASTTAVASVEAEFNRVAADPYLAAEYAAELSTYRAAG